jgi:hypothetical protein
MSALRSLISSLSTCRRVCASRFAYLAHRPLCVDGLGFDGFANRVHKPRVLQKGHMRLKNLFTVVPGVRNFPIQQRLNGSPSILICSVKTVQASIRDAPLDFFYLLNRIYVNLRSADSVADAIPRTVEQSNLPLLSVCAPMYPFAALCLAITLSRAIHGWNLSLFHLAFQNGENRVSHPPRRPLARNVPPS